MNDSNEYRAISRWAVKRANGFYRPNGAAMQQPDRVGRNAAGLPYAKWGEVTLIATEIEAGEISAHLATLNAQTANHVGDGQSWLHAE